MTNEPGLRMVIQKLKAQAEAFLKLFNVSLGNKPSAGHPVSKADTAEALASYGQHTLEIGNELMITDEVVKAYRGLSNSVGRVVVIDQIPTKESSEVKASAFGIQVKVGMREAQQMRAAYLAWQEA
jgi:hypothetical protein